MNLFNEYDENNKTPENEAVDRPENEPAVNAQAEAPPEQSPAPPVNEYWVQNQNGTTPHGYGQGYRPPYQPGGYQQQPYRQWPDHNTSQQYQYNPNSGWQQPQHDHYQWNFQDYDKAAGSRQGEKPKRKRNRGLVVFMTALICVLAAGLIGMSMFGVISSFTADLENAVAEIPASSVTEEQDNPAAPAVQLETASRPQVSEALPIGEKMTTPQVARAVSPSVVGVVQFRPDMTIAETGEGSGIIMTADGYIITNAHVVAGGTDFKVILHDGTPKDADLIGADPLTDLAVLKINDASDLTPAVFGDSNQIEVGEQVIAIGNPGGKTLAGSVTQGIVSAVNREIPNAANLPMNIPLIQTDAAINPGNSGGALVNQYGQVIGINSSKIVAHGFEGIGFAIPISEAVPIVEDIVNNGRVTGRVKLGITARAIDEIDARNTGLVMGIRIEAIDPDSDLNNKGIQKFDIITHINGERIFTTGDLRGNLEKHRPGDRVTLTLYRALGANDNNTFDVTVTLMEDK